MSKKRHGRGTVDPTHDVERELDHHIAELTDRLVEQGMTRESARSAALDRFGDRGRWRGELEGIAVGREGFARAAGIVRDFRHALRQFRRAPGFALLAVLTLGLGIGASTAMFGVVKAVVLDPLPHPDPNRLFELFEVTPDGARFSVADANYLDFEDRVSAFAHLAASSRSDLAWVTDSRPLNIIANQVTPSYFDVFKSVALIGRTFAEAEGGPQPARVAVVAHSFWERHFGGRAALGETLVLDDIAFTIVGVMPEGWGPLGDPDLWIPLAVSSASRSDHTLRVVGRLSPDATLERAATETSAIARILGAEHPQTNENWDVRLVSLKEELIGADRIRGGWILLGAVGLLLVLACGSVANLLIARASTRVAEMGLRTALGASRGRLAQQLMVESLTLAGCAAVVGVGFAYAAIPAIQAVSPPDAPRIDEATVSGSVVIFSVALALLTGVLFGLLPMLSTERAAGSASRSGSGSRGRSGERLRQGLVASQVATTVVLLVGTGLLASSFFRMQNHDVGINLAGTSAVPLMMSGDRYTDSQRLVAATAMREQLQAIPGVKVAGTTNVRPFSGASTAIALAVEGVPSSPEDAEFVRWRLAGPGYFTAAGLDLVTGRLFEDLDYAPNSESVVVVTRALARALFGDAESVLGRRIAMGWDGTNWRRIVGVVPDVEDRRVGAEPPKTFFMPDTGHWPWVIFLVRSDDPDILPNAQAIRDAIWSVDAGLPIPAIEPLRVSHNTSVAGPRFNVSIMAVFGGVALLLSIMGVYGVTLFSVSRRTREIGIRMAVGAKPGSLVLMLLRQGAGLAGVGVMVGVVLAAILSRFVESLLFQTPPHDPWSILAASGVTFLAVLLATLVPALRATRIDPRAALSAD